MEPETASMPVVLYLPNQNADGFITKAAGLGVAALLAARGLRRRRRRETQSYV
jgi:hypothetical protein